MKSGEILKIAGTCYEIDDYKIYKTDRNYTIVEDEIKSHSKNIIDLIEAGDYVNYKLIIEKRKTKNKMWLLAVDELPEYRVINETLIYESLIETVLTHEQYEQDCYRML